MTSLVFYTSLFLKLLNSLLLSFSHNLNKKYCGFCHCGDNSTLGQGDIWLFESTFDLNSCKNYLTKLKEKYDGCCLNEDDFNYNDNNSREANDRIINKIRKIFEK
jgi:hypothetical protein